MASSDKPDFIEIDQKEAPVNLTTGAEAGPEVGAAAGTGGQAVDLTAVPTAAMQGSSDSPGSDSQRSTSSRTSTASPLLAQPNAYFKTAYNPKINDDVLALQKRSMSPGNSMRKLPGGSVTFIGLLVAVCFFGNQLDELRNRTLTDLAKGFAIDNRGFVETVADFGASLRRHRKLDEAKAVYEKSLIDLSVNNQDKGAKGAFIRLKLAEIAFANANAQSAIGYAQRSTPEETEKAFQKSRDYKKEAEDLAQKALEMLRADNSSLLSETPFLLHSVADEFENWSDYQNAIQLNELALEIWGPGSPNRRANVNGSLGFEYLMSKQFEKAEDRLKKSLTWSMRDGNTGYNSWRQSILGRAQVGLKKYMDAEQSLVNARKMHEAFTRKDPDADTDLARIYTDLGRVRAAQGKMAEAQQLFEKSAEILEPKKRRRWDYLRNQLELANLYRDIGQFTKAEDLYADIMGRLYQGDEGPDRKDVKRDWDLLREQRGTR